MISKKYRDKSNLNNKTSLYSNGTSMYLELFSSVILAFFVTLISETLVEYLLSLLTTFLAVVTFFYKDSSSSFNKLEYYQSERHKHVRKIYYIWLFIAILICVARLYISNKKGDKDSFLFGLKYLGSIIVIIVSTFFSTKLTKKLYKKVKNGLTKEKRRRN